MRAIVWSDYICPWCYVALDRVAVLEDLGVEVTVQPYELHPEIPAAGVDRPVGRGGRLAEECAAAGLPYAPPGRVPNSRLALQTAEAVRVARPEAFAELHRSLFAARFRDGRDIGDRRVLDELVGAAGADPVAARRLVEDGTAGGIVGRSMSEAREAGAAGTPTWLLEGSLLVPGSQPREFFERVVSRLARRAG